MYLFVNFWFRMYCIYKHCTVRKESGDSADQKDPKHYREEELAGNSSWRKNHSSSAAPSDKVKDVLDDQSRRGQVLKLTEHDARKQYPDLVVGGSRGKPRTLRRVKPQNLDQGSRESLAAADLKRVMWEKARLGEKTFALTADVAEAPANTDPPT